MSTRTAPLAGKKRKRHNQANGEASSGSKTIKVAGKEIIIKDPPQTSKITPVKPPPIVAPKTSSAAIPTSSHPYLPSPSDLPIRPHADFIRTSLAKSDVLIISGETGSGKSTLVPQFLLTAPWRRDSSYHASSSRNKNHNVNKHHHHNRNTPQRIAVTQPRRVAAINLARRVAQELGTPVGRSSPAAKVGYSVRFDDNVGKSNAIKFLTEGMLLQEILRDPALEEYDVVIVDEVHERSVNVDLILGFLKQLVCGVEKSRRKTKLKVVIMSATADVDALRDFFNNEDDPVNGHDDHEGKPKALNRHDATSTIKKEDRVATCLVKGRQFPVDTIYLPRPADDFVDAALKAVFQIHCKEPMPGDILVFLTGQETIQSLQRNLEEYAQSLTKEFPRLLVLPLYAALPQSAQQQVFLPTPRGSRKVILSTNIAETSLTVPGVRFVIDSGKEKRRQFRPRLGLDSLLVKPISQSSAIQRKGRAGREGPGKCWRLYTETDYLGLETRHSPEILRCDLSDSVLKMKVNGVQDPSTFPLLTRPTREALSRALISLHQLGALTDLGDVSDIGRKMARLPLSPALARTLVAASTAAPDVADDAQSSVILPVLDIVSCFSTENQIFLPLNENDVKPSHDTSANNASNPRQHDNNDNDDDNNNNEYSNAHEDTVLDNRARLHRRQGDHLTLLATVQAFTSTDPIDRKPWCHRHRVSYRTLQSVLEIRKQLRAQLRVAGMLPPPHVVERYDSGSGASVTTTVSAAATSAAAAAAAAPVDDRLAAEILKSFLHGLRSNIARLTPDGSYRTLSGNQTVAIHPSSVLFGKKRSEAIIYNEFVFTNRTFARGVSAVLLEWVAEVL